MFCGNCGKELEKDCKVCPSCGAAVAQGETPVVKLIQPFSDKKVSGKTVIAAVCAVVLLIVVVFGMTMGQKSISKIVKPLKWGMSSEQVAKTMGKDAEISEASDEAGTYRVAEYINLYGNDDHVFAVVATCVDDKLSEIFIFTELPDDLKLYNKIIDDLTKLYRKPATSKDSSGILFPISLDVIWNDGDTQVTSSYTVTEKTKDTGHYTLMIEPA